MKVMLSPKQWRFAVEGGALLISVLATYYGTKLTRHWLRAPVRWY